MRRSFSRPTPSSRIPLSPSQSAMSPSTASGLHTLRPTTSVPTLPVAAATSTRSRAARWHLRQQRGRLPRCSSPQTHPNFAVLRHVGALAPGGAHGLLRATMTPTGAVNRLWRCAVAGGTAGAAAYELFQCLCAQPPSRVGSPGDTYTICEPRIQTKVTRHVCCGVFWKSGRLHRESCLCAV